MSTGPPVGVDKALHRLAGRVARRSAGVRSLVGGSASSALAALAVKLHLLDTLPGWGKAAFVLTSPLPGLLVGVCIARVQGSEDRKTLARLAEVSRVEAEQQRKNDLSRAVAQIELEHARHERLAGLTGIPEHLARHGISVRYEDADGASQSLEIGGEHPARAERQPQVQDDRHLRAVSKDETHE